MGIESGWNYVGAHCSRKMRNFLFPNRDTGCKRRHPSVLGVLHGGGRGPPDVPHCAAALGLVHCTRWIGRGQQCTTRLGNTHRTVRSNLGIGAQTLWRQNVARLEFLSFKRIVELNYLLWLIYTARDRDRDWYNRKTMIPSSLPV